MVTSVKHHSYLRGRHLVRGQTAPLDRTTDHKQPMISPIIIVIVPNLAHHNLAIAFPLFLVTRH